MWSYNKKNNRGMALIEIVIGASIISVGILAISTAYNTYVQHAFANEKNIQAAYILEEGLEAVTLLRDKGWNANIKLLSTTTTPQYIDGTFLRNIAITDVKRDLNDRIATAGTYDPNTKLVTATVSYFQGHGTTTRSLSTYIANIYNN